MTAPRFDRPDAIIVGSGAGGGTAAHALTARGLTVTVLEKARRTAPSRSCRSTSSTSTPARR